MKKALIVIAVLFIFGTSAYAQMSGMMGGPKGDMGGGMMGDMKPGAMKKGPGQNMQMM